MKSSIEAVPAAQMVELKKKRGRPELPFTAKELDEHNKALKKERDARYHKRLKEGLTANAAALESRQTRNEDGLMNMQAKKVKVLVLRGKKQLSKENDKLKKQLKKQEALLLANAKQIETMVDYLEDMKSFFDEHVEFFDLFRKKTRKKESANQVSKHAEHWKLDGRVALEKVINEGQQ